MHLWTKLYIKLRCKHVGSDLYGNQYFIEKHFQSKKIAKRFVVFNGEPEASKVGAGWHAWIHHTTNEIPKTLENGKQKFHHKKLLANHCPNLTGTIFAYNPSLTHNKAAKNNNLLDYTPWQP